MKFQGWNLQTLFAATIHSGQPGVLEMTQGTAVSFVLVLSF